MIKATVKLIFFAFVVLQVQAIEISIGELIEVFELGEKAVGLPSVCVDQPCKGRCTPGYKCCAELQRCIPVKRSCNNPPASGKNSCKGGFYWCESCDHKCLKVGRDKCPKFGCTDSSATNYDSKATDDDGSCQYGDCSVCPDAPCEGRCTPGYKCCSDSQRCIPKGRSCNNLPKDGYLSCKTGYQWCPTCGHKCLGTGRKAFAPKECCPKADTPVPGCTDPSAQNYNPNANQDNGSCIEEDVCEAQKYIDIGFTCSQLENAGWSMESCDCPAVQCASQVYINAGYKCEDLLMNGYDVTGCGCEDTCTYVCQQYINQGYTCQECELAGLECSSCDACGGCQCKKYMDQGYACSQIEAAGLDCTGCNCSPCKAQAYFNMGYDCVHLMNANVDVTDCGCDNVCACQEYLNRASEGYTCALLESYGMDCKNCDCSPVCSDTCKKYLAEPYWTCELLAGYGINCDGCSCQELRIK